MNSLKRLLQRREYVVTLDDVLPMYGEGDTREEAIADLIGSLRTLQQMFEEDPSNLSATLREELRFLRLLMDGGRHVTWPSGIAWTTNA